MKVVNVGLENEQDSAKEIMKGGGLCADRNARPSICWGPLTEKSKFKEDLCQMEETEAVMSCHDEVTSFQTLPSHSCVLMVQEKSYPSY